MPLHGDPFAMLVFEMKELLLKTAGIRLVKWAAVLATAIAIGQIASIELRHWFDFGHFTPLSAHADVFVSHASIGIPGISKMYEAVLTNNGFWPVAVEKCTYTSDVGENGQMVAYNIQRWDLAKKEWKETHKFALPEFCSPMPTSMGNTHWVKSWLWPGESLSTHEEATAAREPFKIGDAIRFVIVTDVTGSGRDLYATPKFTLDEAPQDQEVRYRLSH